MIENRELARLPDEDLPLDSNLNHLVTSLSISAEQLQIIPEEFAHRPA